MENEEKGMNRLQEKLDFLLEKYSVDTKVVLKDCKTVVINGMELPILSHRSERRFVELKNIVNRTRHVMLIS